MRANLTPQQIEEKKNLGIGSIEDLYKEFHDNQRPDGDDFAILINSYHHRNAISLGLPVNSSDDAPLANEQDIERGYIRWNGENFQYWDGEEWVDFGGGIGAEFNNNILKDDNDNLILNVPRGKAILFRTTNDDGSTNDMLTFIHREEDARATMVLNGQIIADNI